MPKHRTALLTRFTLQFSSSFAPFKYPTVEALGISCVARQPSLQLRSQRVNATVLLVLTSHCHLLSWLPLVKLIELMCVTVCVCLKQLYLRNSEALKSIKETVSGALLVQIHKWMAETRCCLHLLLTCFKCVRWKRGPRYFGL